MEWIFSKPYIIWIPNCLETCFLLTCRIENLKMWVLLQFSPKLTTTKKDLCFQHFMEGQKEEEILFVYTCIFILYSITLSFIGKIVAIERFLGCYKNVCSLQLHVWEIQVPKFLCLDLKPIPNYWKLWDMCFVMKH